MLPLLFAATLLLPGSEHALSDPRFAGAAGDQYAAAVASNGTEIVTAWLANGHTFGARIADGRVVDGSGVPLPIDGVPSVVATPRGFVAVWWEGNHMRSALIGSDLTVGPANDLGTFDFSSGLQDLIVLASDGRSVFVVRYSSITSVAGRMLSIDGTPRSDWMMLGGGAVGRTALVADTYGYLLLIAKDSDVPGQQVIYGRRINATGTVNDWQQIAIPNFVGVQQIHAAFDGQREIVVWTTGTGANVSALDPDTLAVGNTASILSGTGFGTIDIGPIARMGDRVIVDYRDWRTADGIIAAAVERTTLAVVDRNVVPINADVRALAIADVSGTSYAIWPENRDKIDFDIFGVPVSDAGVPDGDTFVVSRSAHEQVSPRVADGRSVQLVVWTEAEKPDRVAIRATRVGGSGQPLDIEPLAVSRSGSFCGPSDVAFDGQQFVVVWTDAAGPPPQSGPTRLFLRRIDENGSILDAAPIMIADDGIQPSIACGNGKCLAAWSTSTNHQILAALLSADGSIAPPIAITPVLQFPARVFAPDVAFGGDRFLVAWRTYSWYGYQSPILSGASAMFVTADDSTSEPIELQPLGSAELNTPPKVAWNGSDFIAAWQGSMVHATMLGSIAPVAIDVTGTQGFLNDVAFVNGSWLMTFSSFTAPSGLPEASAMYVSPSLRRELAFSLGAGVSQPALASDGAPVIVDQRVSPELPYGGANRVFLRTLDVPGNPETIPKRRAVRP